MPCREPVISAKLFPREASAPLDRAAKVRIIPMMVPSGDMPAKIKEHTATNQRFTDRVWPSDRPMPIAMRDL